MRRVAVLGCGYVGLELARQLRADGVSVVGVRRSETGLEAVRATGATAVAADVTDAASLAAVPDVGGVVFAASSGGRGATAAREVYVDGLRTTLEHFAAREEPPDRLVYTSSTGVYGDHDGAWVDEETPVEPTTAKTEVLVEAEEVARDARGVGLTPTVVRFAGLYGPDRYRLSRYLEGPVTEGYLNMLHRDDAAGAVRHVLGLADPPETLVAVDDEPVDRWAFADWLADACGVPAPPKRTVEERLAAEDLSDPAARRVRTSKRCANDRLRATGYDLRYPTFRKGYRDAVAAYREAH